MDGDATGGVLREGLRIETCELNGRLKALNVRARVTS